MVEYAERMVNEWHPGEVRDINRDMMRLTLSVVAKTLLNADIEKDANRIGDALTVLLEVTQDAIQSPIQVIPDWIPTKANRKRQAAVRELDEIITGIINERRKSNEDNGDLLSMLMATQDEDGTHMTDPHPPDEPGTIVLAVPRTPAQTLTPARHLLPHPPPHQPEL